MSENNGREHLSQGSCGAGLSSSGLQGALASHGAMITLTEEPERWQGLAGMWYQSLAALTCWGQHLLSVVTEARALELLQSRITRAGVLFLNLLPAGDRRVTNAMEQGCSGCCGWLSWNVLGAG